MGLWETGNCLSVYGVCREQAHLGRTLKRPCLRADDWRAGCGGRSGRLEKACGMGPAQLAQLSVSNSFHREGKVPLRHRFLTVFRSVAFYSQSHVGDRISFFALDGLHLFARTVCLPVPKAEMWIG